MKYTAGSCTPPTARFDAAKEKKAFSAFSVPGARARTVLVDGFSKTYCMTGWRLGWAVMPAHLARKVELLAVHSYGCVAAFTQEAGVAALTGPQDDHAEMLAEYRRRRDFVVAALNKIEGVKCPVPQGAFYAFPDVSAFGKTSAEIADGLLRDAGVAVLRARTSGRTARARSGSATSARWRRSRGHAAHQGVLRRALETRKRWRRRRPRSSESSRRRGACSERHETLCLSARAAFVEP